MKQIKRLTTLVLAVMLLLSLTISASAYTITMGSSADGSGVAGHTYNVYQIYTGTMAEINGEETLGEVKYGQNYEGKTAGTAVPESELEAIKNMTGAAAAEYFNELVAGNPIAVLNDANGHTSADLSAGYYLIVDVSTNLPATETSSAFILEVLDDVEIKSKHTSAPTVEKKIDDKNDSNHTEDEIVWDDSADHDIGDAIPFKLEMVVPSAFAAFKAEGEPYRFVFHDTEEKGLSFNNDAKVYVDGVLIEDGYEVVYPAADGHTFDVVFEDMTAIESIEVGSVVTVVYTSTLTEDANIGEQGNVNKVFGEYNNYYEPEEPVFTPEDAVIAFTYKVVINKVDEDGEALAGATFVLEKFVADANGTAEVDGVKGNWVAKEVVVAEAGDVFTFDGLDDGHYRLTETEAPAGYNKIEPIEFTVTADHDIVWETQGRTDVLNSLSGNKVTGEIEFTESDDHGTLSSDVENKAGVVLPETGGIGTTIFYVLGGMMVLVAVVLLVTKKRMASAE